MTFIGNEVGKKNKNNIIVYSKALLLIWLITMSLITMLLFIFKSEWINFYSANNS